MDYYELRIAIDEIEKGILLHSFSHHLSMSELKYMYTRALEIKEKFLYLQFCTSNVEQINRLRVDILESIYHIKIYLREKRGLPITVEIEALKRM